MLWYNLAPIFKSRPDKTCWVSYRDCFKVHIQKSHPRQLQQLWETEWGQNFQRRLAIPLPKTTQWTDQKLCVSKEMTKHQPLPPPPKLKVCKEEGKKHQRLLNSILATLYGSSDFPENRFKIIPWPRGREIHLGASARVWGHQPRSFRPRVVTSQITRTRPFNYSSRTSPTLTTVHRSFFQHAHLTYQDYPSQKHQSLIAKFIRKKSVHTRFFKNILWPMVQVT